MKHGEYLAKCEIISIPSATRISHVTKTKAPFVLFNWEANIQIFHNLYYLKQRIWS